jgi:hypothetical protein
MLQEVEAPTISRQLAHEEGKAVCQSYAPADLTPSFMLQDEWPQSQSVARSIKSTKNPNDSLRKHIYNLPALSTVPQLTAPLCIPKTLKSNKYIREVLHRS